jgi:hypothetical protein
MTNDRVFGWESRSEAIAAEGARQTRESIAPRPPPTRESRHMKLLIETPDCATTLYRKVVNCTAERVLTRLD